MIERDGKSYVLCTLQHGKHFQQPLDLEFAAGEELTFYIKGKGLHQIRLPVCTVYSDDVSTLTKYLSTSTKFSSNNVL